MLFTFVTHFFEVEIKENSEAFRQCENSCAYNTRATLLSFQYGQCSIFIDEPSEIQFNTKNWWHESSRKKAFNRLAGTQRKAENDSIKTSDWTKLAFESTLNGSTFNVQPNAHFNSTLSTVAQTHKTCLEVIYLLAHHTHKATRSNTFSWLKF